MRNLMNFTALAAVAAGLSMASGAQAALTLTAAGVADNFTLSTYYTSPNNYSLLGITTASNGKVIAAGYGLGVVASLNDIDGQTQASFVSSVASPGTPTSTATVGGKTYLSTLGGAFNQVDPNTLALTPITVNGGASGGYGLWGNQVTGHLLSSSSQGLIDIDPNNGNVKFIAGGFYDGVSVSPDGKIAYAEANSNSIVAYDIATATLLKTYSLAHNPDGTGVISGGAFSGFIIANNNDGTVSLVDPVSGVETVIASGGTRGDLVGPDLTNGTLFLSEYDAEYRLGISGGVIGGGGAPEPATWALMLIGVGMMGGALRQSKAKVAPSVS